MPKNTENHANEIIYEFSDSQRTSITNKKGIPLFAAYGCALLERQTASGMYVYTGTNIATGKTEILSRRKNQLRPNDYKLLAAKIASSNIRGESRFSSESKAEARKPEPETKSKPETLPI